MFPYLKYVLMLTLLTLSPQAICAFDNCDLESIHQVMERWKEEWNLNHGQNYHDIYTEKADFVNIFGVHFSGNEEIENRHVHILKTFLKDSVFEILELRVREVQPEVAIVHAVWHVTMHPQVCKEEGGQDMNGIFTHVLIKDGTNWKITASQNTLSKSLYP